MLRVCFRCELGGDGQLRIRRDFLLHLWIAVVCVVLNALPQVRNLMRSRAVLLKGGVEDLNGDLGQSLHVLLLAYYLRLE